MAANVSKFGGMLPPSEAAEQQQRLVRIAGKGVDDGDRGGKKAEWAAWEGKAGAKGGKAVAVM